MVEIIKPGYTRVSTILEERQDFSKIPREIFEHKTEVGSNVHEAIFLHNECLPRSFDLTEEEQAYFDSYLLWAKETGIQTPYNEKRFYDDMFMITGKIDALVKFPYEDKLILADWKTSTHNKKIGRIWEMKGTFYHYLLTKNGFEDISDRFLYIQLDPDGKLPKVREFRFNPSTMALCASAVELYRFTNP